MAGDIGDPDANSIGVEDAYELLQLEVGSNDSQIKSAYRKVSLKLHPDKRRDVDQERAAAEFHRLQLAYELLSDPVKRAAAESKASENAAAKARRGAYEGKRKAAADELEKREEEDRKRRKTEAQDEANRANKLRQAQEESRRMMEEAQRKKTALAAQAEAQEAEVRKKKEQAEAANAPPPVGPFDTTVVVRFPTSQLQEMLGMGSVEDLATQLASASSKMRTETPLGQALSAAFGPLEALAVNPPKRKKKTGAFASEMSAAATFTSIDAAFAAVSAGQNLNAPGILADCFIKWVGGGKKAAESQKEGANDHTHEPDRIRWMRQKGLLKDIDKVGAKPSSLPAGLEATSIQGDSTHARSEPVKVPTSFSFSPFPAQTKHGSNSDYESITLMRLRDAERRKLETQILEQERRD